MRLHPLAAAASLLATLTAVQAQAQTVATPAPAAALPEVLKKLA